MEVLPVEGAQGHYVLAGRWLSRWRVERRTGQAGHALRRDRAVTGRDGLALSTAKGVDRDGPAQEGREERGCSRRRASLLHG